MATDTHTDELDVRELLEAACARNLSAEIHFEDDDELRRARMRLLAIEDDHIRIDKPMSIGKPFTLRPRQRITVFFVHDRISYAFKSQIIGPIIVTDLNAQKRVKGALLRMPKAVSHQQRRHDYRLSLAHTDIAARFHVLDSEYADCAPIDPTRFEGRITNLSGGGLAIMVKAVPGRKFQINDQFRVSFSLPETEESLVLTAELRIVRRIHEGEGMVIGLQFCGRNRPENREVVRRIRRFIADEQRRQLRANRGR